jgi:hypothetical protein
MDESAGWQYAAVVYRTLNLSAKVERLCSVTNWAAVRKSASVAEGA